MNLVKVILATLLVLLAACSSTQSQLPLNTSLQFSELDENNVRYSLKSTAAGITSTEKEATILLVGEGTTYARKNALSFGESNAEKYISMLDLYLEWEEEATDHNRTNIHKKPIGKVLDSSGKNYLYFMFYSGNTTDYRMMISDCEWLCTDDSIFQYYDKANVLELKKLLRMLMRNELESIVIQTDEVK